MSNNFDNVVVGDLVIETTPVGFMRPWETRRVLPVVSVSKTQMTCKSSRTDPALTVKFSKKNGFMVGHSGMSRCPFITAATEELLREVRNENARRNLLLKIKKAIEERYVLQDSGLSLSDLSSIWNIVGPDRDPLPLP